MLCYSLTTLFLRVPRALTLRTGPTRSRRVLVRGPGTGSGRRSPSIVPTLAFRLGLMLAAVRDRLHPTSRGDAAHGEHVCTTFIPMSAVPVRAIAALKAPKGTTISDEGSRQ